MKIFSVVMFFLIVYSGGWVNREIQIQLTQFIHQFHSSLGDSLLKNREPLHA